MTTNCKHIKLPEPWFALESLFFPKPYHTQLHRHAAWQISASLKGTFYYNINGERVLTGPGEWILLSPELMHDVGSDSQNSKAFQVFFRKFPEDLFPEPSKLLNLKRNFYRTGKIRRRLLEMLYKDVCCCMDFPEKSKFPMSRIIQSAQFFVMNCMENLDTSNLIVHQTHPKLLSVIKYMEEHYREPAGIPEFSRIAGLSGKRFSDLFKSELNETPVHFFNSIRLGHAQEMLLRGCSVKETAAECGFTTVQYFCRFFMRWMNVSPSEFREAPFLDQKIIY